jgi:hypothetical protein
MAFTLPGKTIASSRHVKGVPAKNGSCENNGLSVLLDRKEKKKMESKRTFSKSLF